MVNIIDVTVTPLVPTGNERTMVVWHGFCKKKVEHACAVLICFNEAQFCILFIPPIQSLCKGKLVHPLVNSRTDSDWKGITRSYVKSTNTAMGSSQIASEDPLFLHFPHQPLHGVYS